MGKLTKIMTLALYVMLVTGSIAMAETKFTPLNFDDSNAVKTTNSTTTITKATVDQKGNVMLDPSQVTGGKKMQSAILDLDNAQVEVRNQLLNYRNNYTEIDTKYQTAKTERKNAKKRIKQAEKQIKNMEKAKTKIKKNFEQKSNI